MLTKENIEQFCFDVLGDFMPERAYEITEMHGKPVVIVLYKGLVQAPKEIIFDEWNRAKAGTDFEEVSLFM
jgi:hypothetical protein